MNALNDECNETEEESNISTRILAQKAGQRVVLLRPRASRRRSEEKEERMQGRKLGGNERRKEEVTIKEGTKEGRKRQERDF